MPVKKANSPVKPFHTKRCRSKGSEMHLELPHILHAYNKVPTFMALSCRAGHLRFF